MYKIIFILFFLPLSIVNAQNNLLAKNYFEQGEYDKALALYTNLYKKNKNFNYFKAIVASHQQLENFKEAEQLLKERLNNKRIIPQLYVELGHNYSLQENDTLANIYYDKALLFVNESKKFNYGRIIGESFERYSLLNYAIENIISIDKDMTETLKNSKEINKRKELSKNSTKSIYSYNNESIINFN